MEVEQLFEEYYTPLYRYIRARTPNEDEALDLTQNVFLKVLKNGGEVTAPRAYLFTIARTTLVDFYRKKKSVVASSIDLDIDTLEGIIEYNPEENAVLVDTHNELYEYVQALPEVQQEAIRLRYFSELSYAEIAEILDKTEVNIRKIISRAIKELALNYE